MEKAIPNELGLYLHDGMVFCTRGDGLDEDRDEMELLEIINQLLERKTKAEAEAESLREQFKKWSICPGCRRAARTANAATPNRPLAPATPAQSQPNGPADCKEEVRGE